MTPPRRNSLGSRKDLGAAATRKVFRRGYALAHC